MAEFSCNNTKNTKTSYIYFKLHCDFHSQTFYRYNINFCSLLRSVVELVSELKKQIIVYRKKL